MSDLVERLRRPITATYQPGFLPVASIAEEANRQRSEAASRISQQDAELERLRREVEEAKRQIDFGIHQSDLERATIVARRDAFSEAEEVVRHLCSNNEEAISALRRKAEETGR